MSIAPLVLQSQLFNVNQRHFTGPGSPLIDTVVKERLAYQFHYSGVKEDRQASYAAPTLVKIYSCK